MCQFLLIILSQLIRYERDTRRHLIYLVRIVFECSDLTTRWAIGTLFQPQALVPASRLIVSVFVDCSSG
jgi:hypothetical protein